VKPQAILKFLKNIFVSLLLHNILCFNLPDTIQKHCLGSCCLSTKPA